MGRTETAVSSPTPPTWQDRRSVCFLITEGERIRRARDERERGREMTRASEDVEGRGVRPK